MAHPFFSLHEGSLRVKRRSLSAGFIFSLLILLMACEREGGQPAGECWVVEVCEHEPWSGTITEACGLDGDAVLKIRFDPETVPDSAKRYRLEPIATSMDSLRKGQVFTDTLRLCQGIICHDEAINVEVTAFSADIMVGAILRIRELPGDSTVSRILNLRKQDSTGSCL